MAERSWSWRIRLLWPAQRCSLCALRVAQRSIGHRLMRGQTVDQVVMPLSIYQDSCRSRETCSYTLPARPDRNDPDRRRLPLVIACSDGMKWEREIRATDGKIKRTGVRWLPPVAKSCLHIGFCTLRRYPGGAVQCGVAPLSEISSLISILQPTAPAMCADESARRWFATLRN
jgi:hypothetical protein